MTKDERFEDLRDRLGLGRVSEELLELAFTHSSYSREQGLEEQADNQRLEYLGDAVLDLACAEHLYRTRPDLPEGDLTRLKAAVVRKSALASVARCLELGGYILLGRGEESTGGRRKASLLADVVEALIGAVFLSGGYEAAQKFVLRNFRSLLEEVEACESLRDHKSSLQEILQARSMPPPRYHVTLTEGPPHDRWFSVEASINGEVIGSGEGAAKRIAEQAAAEEALATIDEWLED